MPPVDWSIIQSLLVTLIFPCFAVGAGVLAFIYGTTKSEVRRSIAASLVFLAAMIAGNYRGQLVPLLAVQRVADSVDAEVSNLARNFLFSWEFETGWYSLFSVTFIAVLAEVLIDWRRRHALQSRNAALASVLVALVTAIWLTPWGQFVSKPWVSALLAIVVYLNTATLRYFSRLSYGHFVPLVIAVTWGGSAAALVVFAHSARFADLAILLSSSLAAVGLVNVIAKQRLVSLFSGPATFIPGLMLGAAMNTYSEIPAASFALVAMAPGLLAFFQIPKLKDWSEKHPIAVLFASLIQCVIAVGLAIRAES